MAEELHKPVVKKFKKRRVVVKGIDQIWAADLVDMSAYSKQNIEYKYILAIIDVFSKYGWMIPLKNKSSIAVAEPFKIILGNRKPEKLWVDKGSEFYNKHVKSLFKDPTQAIYSTENEEKSSVIEHWNRTMKQKMYKYFTASNSTKYYTVLDDLVNEYNNTYTSIKMTPVEASKKINSKVGQNLFPKVLAKKIDKVFLKEIKSKFKVGDRITKKKRLFEKSYTPNWTTEIFVIDKVIYTDPVTYKIRALPDPKEEEGEEIIGSFYEKELLKTKF